MNKGLAALIIGRALVVVCSVFSVRFYTEILGPMEVGVMSLVLGVISLFSLLVGSVSLFFYRQTTEWYARARLPQNIFRYCAFLVGAALVSCVILPAPYWFGDPAWRSIPLAWFLALVAGNVIIVS